MGKDSVTPSYEELKAMRENGATRPEIARHYGVAVARVKRWIADMQVPARVTKKAREDARPPKRIREVSPPPPPPGSNLTLMERAKRALGDRLGENHIGYTLDGRPANTWQILRAAGVTVAGK